MLTSQLNYLTISENSHLRRLQAKKWGFFSLHPIMKKGMSRLQFIYLEIIANQLPLPIINEKFILLYVAPYYEIGRD